ncbi:20471_t:CDS:2 [Cetraspora pellucida]|uniref:20471_t:CDS:1 n=1 Tax=Cetraspora pellucida TaxID=1433469 RepID=A0A9N9K1K9_9GLOM|nr:20471_t:CDS:2 [Cetraspora pellucida]
MANTSRRAIAQQLRRTCERELQICTSEPNRRAIAQQERRERERVGNTVNQRAVSQQERRRHERIENTIDRRSIAQQSRRELERAKRALCIHCGALHWLDERIVNSPKTNPKFGSCCRHGKVILPLLHDPPLLLRQLFEGQDEQCKEFRANIRQYNAVHAFTLLGVNIDQTILNGRSPYSFRIHGELRHRSGLLLPESSLNANYAQLYIYDPDIAHQIRMGRNKNLHTQTMWELQEILREHHAFYPIYQQAHEILSQVCEEGVSETDLAVHLHFNAATDRHRYNLLTSNEIAVILPGDGSEPKAMRDIVIRLRGGPLEHIHEAHPAYLPLHYVLFFPHRELGWHAELHHTLIDEYGQYIEDQSKASRLTQMDFYSFCLFSRHTEFSTILRGGKLLQEFMGLADALGTIVNEEINLNNLGRCIILPSTHIGSACHMFEIFQDSMAIT